VSSDSISGAIDQLVSSGMVDREDLAGCTQEDLERIEAEAGVRLPASYKQLMSVAGRSAGRFLEGSDFLFPAVTGLKADAVRLLRECGTDWHLSPTEFVFVGHQGYQFLFFDCAKGDDPPVYLFVEGDEKPREVYSHFSAWFEECVLDEIAGDA
jgi:hypothetical protein